MTPLERRTRLVEALRHVGVQRPRLAASTTANELEQRYGEPHREYHTVTHVESCLAWLDAYRDHAQCPAELELALWFHDAVYDPARRDNETRSATLAETSLRNYRAAPAAIDRVAQLIRATQAHLSTTGDAALLCSIDLAILGAAPSEYRRYTESIRTEYRHVPPAIYEPARRAFAASLLKRRVLYPTPVIRQRLERQARRNLACELALTDPRSVRTAEDVA